MVQKVRQTYDRKRQLSTKGEIFIPKPRTPSGEKNLISKHLIQLRQERGLSQRDLAHQLQLAGYDIDKNVITRIETNQRFVTDIELQAFCQVLGVNFDDLIDREDKAD